jgi:hypothetical protein
VLIERAAARFRYHEQPVQNAHDVIAAILKPSASQGKLSFSDFCRLLAMFGPERTIMVKISGLLTCSNATGKWLVFGRDDTSGNTGPVASFSREVPNCLVIRHGDLTQEKVFNLPLVEALGDSYLADEIGKLYKNWDEYFTIHPVRPQSGALLYQYA